MQMALDDAGLKPGDLGYLNLHGTGTVLNDRSEALAVNALCGKAVPCSSTKHLTGHTLGAAGIIELLLLALLLERELPLPAQDFSVSPLDPDLPPCGILSESEPWRRPFMLSNSLAFGGSNTSLLLERCDV